MAENDDRLTLVRELSRSGIATVWEAYDATLDRKVLLKAIHPQFARESDLRARFEREAKAIARLRHPCVVQIYDVRKGPDELSLLLEFVEGQSLGALLKEHVVLPLEAALTITAQILLGLIEAHAEGIIHRDLKPDNVLVSNKGEVKITDFGLATLKDQPTVTMAGMVVGTPAYMAPEQAGGGEITARTDLFALGLILYEMLIGQRVIQGATQAEAYQNACNYTPPKMGPFDANIPLAIIPILSKMLEKNPDKRYSSAQEVYDTLQANFPDALLPPPLLQDFLAGRPIPKSVPKKITTSRVRPRWLQFGALVTVAVLVMTLAYYFGTMQPPVTTHKTKPDSTAGDTVVPPDTAKPDSVTEPRDTVSRKPNVKQSEQGENGATIPPVNTPVKKDTTTQVAANGTSAAIGWFKVRCKPWAEIYVNDSLRGTSTSADSIKLNPGNYSVVLINPGINVPIMRTVTVEPNKLTELTMNLEDYLAKIRAGSVKPWADVYVDGMFIVQAPNDKIIYKPLGKHKIELKNPSYPIFTKEVIFAKGDPVYEIRYDLAQPDTSGKTPK